MALKHVFKMYFGIIWSNAMKTVFNCQFIFYYDANSIIWKFDVFAINSRSNLQNERTIA